MMAEVCDRHIEPNGQIELEVMDLEQEGIGARHDKVPDPKDLAKDEKRIYIDPRSAWGLYFMYALVGLVNGFFVSYINVPFCQYVFGPMNSLGHTTTQQCAVAGSIVQMPWNFKVFYGFVLDRVSFCGSRRRGWIIFGWTACFVILLGLTSFAQELRDTQNFAVYTLSLMVMEIFLITADVAGDGMTIELTKHEDAERRGYILTTGQLTRFAMKTVVQLIGIFCMNGQEYYLDSKRANATLFSFSLKFWQVHLLIFCLALPLFFGMVYFLQDPPKTHENNSHPSFVGSLSSMWYLLKTKAFLFLILFNIGNLAVAGLANPANNDISLIATPTTLQNSVGGLLGNLFFMAGVVAFRRYFMNRNWRFTLFWTSSLLVLTGLLGLMTIYNTWGIGQDGWFYTLTGVIPEFIVGIAQVLTSLAIAEISPSGGEAFTYEFITTLHNCAIALNMNLSNIFVPVFSLGDISLEKYQSATYREKEVYNSNMADATYLTLGINVAGLLLFMWLLPKDRYQTLEWLSDKAWHRPSVACLGLGIAVAAFAFSTLASFLSLFPETMCLKIAGGDGC